MSDIIIEKVNPVIVYPDCLLNGIKQDCFKCGKRGKCESPRGLCVTPYHNHPRGCPNYGKKIGCPPNIEMFDQYYDISKDIFAIITFYDIAGHLEKQKIKHPDWTKFQLANSRHWQEADRKIHKLAIAEFNKMYPDFVVTTWPEALGVNLKETLKQINIELKFPTTETVNRTSLAGIIPVENYDKYYLCIEEGIYHEKTLKKR